MGYFQTQLFIIGVLVFAFAATTGETASVKSDKSLNHEEQQSRDNKNGGLHSSSSSSSYADVFKTFATSGSRLTKRSTYECPPAYLPNMPSYNPSQVQPGYNPGHTLNYNSQTPVAYKSSQDLSSYNAPQAPPAYQPPQSPLTYPQAPPPYQPPQSPPNYPQAPPPYQPPQSPPNYPQAPPPYQPPQSPPTYSAPPPPAYQPPQSPPSYNSPQSSPNYNGPQNNYNGQYQSKPYVHHTQTSYATPGSYANSYNNFIPIQRFNHHIKPALHQYDVEFEAGNGIRQQESGFLKKLPAQYSSGYGYQQQQGYNSQNGGVANVKTGSVSWTSPEGYPISFSYIADENGYRPIGSHLYNTGTASKYATSYGYNPIVGSTTDYEMTAPSHYLPKVYPASSQYRR